MGYLECRNLRQSYGKKFSLDLSFSMDKGELLCIIGPSGSGKSTLLSLVSGIEDLQNGNIFLDGQDITRMPIQKRRIGMVFQDFSLFPTMNVEQNIQFGMVEQNKDARTQEILNLVGLDGYGKRKVHELSGGEAQRIALARAIAAQPRILLLDEPLSALDAPLRKRLRTVIKQIHQKTGTTMLYVTHDREEAFAVADRILILKGGRIEAIGKPEDLYRNPPSLFVASFTGEGSIIPMSSVDDNTEKRAAFVRPEDIKIEERAEADTDCNSIVIPDARITETEFNGTSYIVSLDCNGHVIKALTDRKPESDTVGITIRREKILYF